MFLSYSVNVIGKSLKFHINTYKLTIVSLFHTILNINCCIDIPTF